MKRYAWLVPILMVAVVLAGCKARSQQSAPVSAPSAATPAANPNASAPANLPGDASALKAALAEQGSLKYQIVTTEIKDGDKDAYLDKLLANKQWPDKAMMVLVVYTDANFDIRFAMGADFFAKQVTVDEALALVRSAYLPKARQGDPSGGLADLVRAMNQRMK